MPINVVLESKGAIPKQAVVELMRDGEVLQSRDLDFTPGNARRSVDFRQTLSEKQVWEVRHSYPAARRGGLGRGESSTILSA